MEVDESVICTTAENPAEDFKEIYNFEEASEFDEATHKNICIEGEEPIEIEMDGPEQEEMPLLLAKGQPQEEEEPSKSLEDIPAVSEEFQDLFDKVCSLDRNEHLAAQRHLKTAWRQFYNASQQVILEGDLKPWMACAVYMAMLLRNNAKVATHCSMTAKDILRVYEISALEFFDKINRWCEIVEVPKKVKEHVYRIQSNLAVSSVVYKKLLPIFRRLFVFVDTPGEMTTTHILKIIWNIFLYLKKQMQSEDLLNSFHLLLCTIELVYRDIIVNHNERYLNQVYVQSVVDGHHDNEGILDALCKEFEGVLLDAKHFREHWFFENKVILQLDSQPRFAQNYRRYLEYLEGGCEETERDRCEVDEAMFIPENAEVIFDPLNDATATEMMRQGSKSIMGAQPHIMLKMATQVCLERITDVDKKVMNTVMSARSFTITNDQAKAVAGMDQQEVSQSERLEELFDHDYRLSGSELERICLELSENALNIIHQISDVLADRLLNELRSLDLTPEELGKMTEITVVLFYQLVEKIAMIERSRFSDDIVLSTILRKEEFLHAVFACAVELICFCYFPSKPKISSIQLVGVAPLALCKVIEIVVRTEKGLTREMIRHLSRREEEVLEELAWLPDSPIWAAIENHDIPSCEEAWSGTVRNAMSTYSPLKRPRLSPNECDPVNQAHEKSLALFFRKVYYIVIKRLNDLCERVRIEDKGKKLVWAILEHIIREEPEMLMSRHIDQNILCAVYVVTKVMKMDCLFMDIMSQYRHQPQAKSSVYREVVLDTREDASVVPAPGGSDEEVSCDSTNAMAVNPLRAPSASLAPTPGISSLPPTPEPTISAGPEKVDLIRYYNRVFLPKIQDVVKHLSAGADQSRLCPVPIPRGFGLSPVKRIVDERVRVCALQKNGAQLDRPFRYSTKNSPRKDLQAMNRVTSAGSIYYSVANIADKGNSYGPIYRP